MVNQEFIDWLENEMRIRSLTRSDLARLSSLSTAAISDVLNGRRSPGPDLCTGIANALKYSPEYVFRMSGLLPKKVKETQHHYEINAVLDQLPQDDQQELLEIALLKLKRLNK